MVSAWIECKKMVKWRVHAYQALANECLCLFSLGYQDFTCTSRKPLIWSSSTHAGLAARRQQIWPHRAKWGMFEPSVVVAKGLAPTKPTKIICINAQVLQQPLISNLSFILTLFLVVLCCQLCQFPTELSSLSVAVITQDMKVINIKWSLAMK